MQLHSYPQTTNEKRHLKYTARSHHETKGSRRRSLLHEQTHHLYAFIRVQHRSTATLTTTRHRWKRRTRLDQLLLWPLPRELLRFVLCASRILHAASRHGRVTERTENNGGTWRSSAPDGCERWTRMCVGKSPVCCFERARHGRRCRTWNSPPLRPKNDTIGFPLLHLFNFVRRFRQETANSSKLI